MRRRRWTAAGAAAGRRRVGARLACACRCVLSLPGCHLTRCTLYLLLQHGGGHPMQGRGCAGAPPAAPATAAAASTPAAPLHPLGLCALAAVPQTNRHARPHAAMPCLQGAEKLVVSKMLVEHSNRRTYPVDRHAGVAIAGVAADGRAIVARATSEASNYKSTYGDAVPGSVLAERVGAYVHVFNLYWSVGPAGVGGGWEGGGMGGWVPGAGVRMAGRGFFSVPAVWRCPWGRRPPARQCADLCPSTPHPPMPCLCLCPVPASQVRAAVRRGHAAGDLRQGGAAVVPRGPRGHHAREAPPKAGWVAGWLAGCSCCSYC